MDIDNKEEVEETKSSVRVSAILYLITSFNRCTIETVRYNNFKKASLIPKILDLIAICKCQIIKNAVNILTNRFFIFDDCKAAPHEVSPLLLAMYNPNVEYTNFVQAIVDETFLLAKKEFFQSIFEKILEDIFMEMKNSPIKSMEALPLNPINKLIELLDIQLEVNKEAIRPIVNLLIHQKSFYPILSSDITGREVARVSFLGPFLQISILSDENPYFPIDDYYESNTILPMIQTSIQNKLDYIRGLLHKIFYTFILYKDSRDITLNYIAQLLFNNYKRVQYSADERNLARDGFMLNLMSGM
jgi:ubiquitin conjugation factor E4 B